MNILLLGHSGVGKTTFTASVYAELQEEVGGFTVAAALEADHRRLLGDAARIRGGVYPPATNQRDQYRFDLCYLGRRCFQFKLIDYRGSALFERSNSEAARKLVQDMRESSGILVFCDSDALVRSREDVEDEVARMTYLVSQALDGLTRRIALGLVYTKSDLVDKKAHDRNGVFDGLVRSARANDQVRNRGAVMHIACGRRSVNVAQPVLFALRVGICDQVAWLRKKKQSHQAERDRHQENVSVFDDLLCWVFKQTPYREMAQKADTEAERYREMLEKLEEPAQELAVFLTGLEQF